MSLKRKFSPLLAFLVLLCGCAGSYLGAGVRLGITNGAYNRWKVIALPQGSHPSSFLQSDKPFGIYLRTEEDEVFWHNCTRSSDEPESWHPVTETIAPASDPCIAEQPYRNWPTIFVPSSKVKAQISCTYFRGVEAFPAECRYVILENGTTRVWVNDTPRSSSEEIIIMPVYRILFAIICATGGGLLLKHWAYGAEKNAQ